MAYILKSKQKKSMSTLLFLLFCPFSVSAQEKNNIFSLDLKTAMRLAMDHSYDLKAAKATWRSSKSTENEIIAGFGPKISGTYDYTRNSPAVNKGVGNSPSSLTPLHESVGQVTVTLPMLGIIYQWHNLKGQDVQTKINAYLVEQSKEQAALLGATYFLSYLLAQEQIYIAKASLKTMEKSLADARSMLDLGSMAKDDFLQIETQYLQTKQTLQNGIYSLDTNGFQLLQALGLDTRLKVETAGYEKSYFEKKQGSFVTLEKAQNTALKNNPLLNSVKFGIDVAQMQKKLAQDSYLPVVNGVAAFQRIFNTNQINTEGLYPARDLQNNLSYGIQVSVDIFDWGVRKYNIDSLTEQVYNKKYLYEEQKEQTLLQTVQQHTNIKNSFISLDLAKETLKSTKETYEIVQSRFVLGQVTALTFVTAQQNYITAQLTLAQTRFNLDLSWINLKVTLGEDPLLLE